MAGAFPDAKNIAHRWLHSLICDARVSRPCHTTTARGQHIINRWEGGRDICLEIDEIVIVTRDHL